jgi:hypothetical protein
VRMRMNPPGGTGPPRAMQSRAPTSKPLAAKDGWQRRRSPLLGQAAAARYVDYLNSHPAQEADKYIVEEANECGACCPHAWVYRPRRQTAVNGLV